MVDTVVVSKLDQLQVNVFRHRTKPVVVLAFNKSITWVGLDKSTALRVADSLKKYAEGLPDEE